MSRLPRSILLGDPAVFKCQREIYMRYIPQYVIYIPACAGSLLTWHARWFVFEKNIWKGATRNCLEKGKHFQKILGRWLEQPSVYHHLRGDNSGRARPPTEPVVISNSCWSRERSKNIFSINKAFSAALCSSLNEAVVSSSQFLLKGCWLFNHCVRPHAHDLMSGKMGSQDRMITSLSDYWTTSTRSSQSRPLRWVSYTISKGKPSQATVETDFGHLNPQSHSFRLYST